MENRTKIGRALQKIGDAAKPILSILSKVPVPGAELLGEVADAIRTTKEIDSETKQELLHAVTLDMQDLANARAHSVEMQRSQFSSWMAKNIPYFIDVFISLIWGGMTFYIVATAVRLVQIEGVDTSSILGIYAGVTALMTQVLSFHRGSSHGSRLKDVYR